MIIYTLFCISLVFTVKFTLKLAKWLCESSKTPVPTRESAEALNRIKQEVEIKRKSLDNLKQELGLNKTVDLRVQANHLNLVNQKMAKRLEYENKLAPIREQVKKLKEHLGDNVENRILERRKFLSNLKVLEKNNKLKDKINMLRYEQLLMIKNLVNLDHLFDIIRDIEFKETSSALKETTFAIKTEISFLQDEVQTFGKLSEKFAHDYSILIDKITVEKEKSARLEQSFRELQAECDKLENEDSTDQWKRKVMDKMTETDKYYRDYIHNYYGYIHDYKSQEVM